MNSEIQKDLIVLVADKDMEQAVKALLKRHESLRIRQDITFDVLVDPGHDPKVFLRAHEFLRPYQNQYRYCLVMFDRIGSGQEDRSAKNLEDEVQSRLEKAGWRGRCAVVVLDPELEVWVFVDSPRVAEVIARCDEDLVNKKKKCDVDLSTGKPNHPKEVMREILNEKRIPWSSALHGKLAEKVSLAKCQDKAFKKFSEVLRSWFPPKTG